jgi:hypothetical protein
VIDPIQPGSPPERRAPVAGTGEAEESPQAITVHVRAGALVDVDVFLGDARIADRVDLPVEVLGGRADTAIRKIHRVTVSQLDAGTLALTKPYDTSF